MRPSPEKVEELELELPDLDGSEDLPEADLTPDLLDIKEEDLGNPFDDSTAEGDPVELAVDGAEKGWLEDAEDATHLDVGPFDVVLQAEGKILEDEEADGRGHADDIVLLDEAFVGDGGEEGPLADDEELREEDLPALDADEDGDVSEEELYDRATLAVDDDLRWDDRAWARVLEIGSSNDDADDSGLLAVPSEGPTHGIRDATWKMLDESGRIMAATFVPGDSVVVALATADRTRALLVRIQPDGEARIIAEVDPRAARTGAGPAPAPASAAAARPAREGEGEEEDDEPVCIVTFVRWDGARGCLFVGGNFGVEAYRPAV